MGKFYRVTSEIQCLGFGVSALLRIGERVQNTERNTRYSRHTGGWFIDHSGTKSIWVIGGVLRPETPFETAEELIKGEW